VIQINTSWLLQSWTIRSVSREQRTSDIVRGNIANQVRNNEQGLLLTLLPIPPPTENIVFLWWATGAFSSSPVWQGEQIVHWALFGTCRENSIEQKDKAQLKLL